MKRWLSLLSVVLLLSAAIPALADNIVYSNGAINGTINAYTISPPFLVSDSFTLSATTDLESMHFGVWVLPGDIPSTVDFGISATAFGTDLGSGTGTLSNVFQFTNSLVHRKRHWSASKFAVTTDPNSERPTGAFWRAILDAHG